MEVSDNVGSDKNSRRESFGKLDPFRIRNFILTDNFIENNPRIINMKTRILKKKSFDHLFIIGSVYATGDSTVAEYHLHSRKLTQYFFEFMEVFRTIRNPCSGNIIVDRNWQIVCICELENRIERFIVDSRNITVRQKSEIIVPKEDFSDSTPNTRIELVHPFYMFDCVFVRRIESAYERIDSFLIFGRKFLVFFCDDRIGGAVVITFAVIVEIVFWSFPFVLGPLFGYRESEYYGFLDICSIHMGDKIVESLCFLKKIHRMNM